MVLSRWSVSVKRSILFGCCDIYVMMGYICVIPAGINSCVWTDTCELYLDTEQVARGKKNCGWAQKIKLAQHRKKCKHGQYF